VRIALVYEFPKDRANLLKHGAMATDH